VYGPAEFGLAADGHGRGRGAYGDVGEYVNVVGPDFRSTYAEGGQANAKTIDGVPFTDAAGNPIR
jgi:hypothetical protein